MAFCCSINVLAEESIKRLTATELVRQTDDLMNIQNTVAKVELLVFQGSKLRKTYEMDLTYQDEKHMLSETKAPSRQKGQTMLHSGENVWLFLPKINKVIRVSERNSFSNSDFSNLDMMNVGFSEDYDSTLLAIEDYKGDQTYKVELTANNENETYGKLIMWIRASDLFTLRREYYTYSGNLIKEMVLGNKNNIRKNGMPDTFLMTSVLNKNKKTVLRYIELKDDQTFPRETFLKRSLVKK